MKNFSSFYKNKKILITGGEGFLGSKLLRTLLEVECYIVLLTHNGKKCSFSSRKAQVKQITGDITKQKLWPKILSNIDVVFHLGALESQRGSKLDPLLDLKTNAEAVLLMLETCRIKNIYPKIVFSSSTNLYGITKKSRVNEQFPDDPLLLFSIHKLTAEHYLRLYARDYGVPSVCLRIANLYGPSISYHTTLRPVLNRIMQKAIQGGPLTVFNNKNNIRDYLYIDDAVQALLTAGSSKKLNQGQSIVVGSQEKTSIGNVIKLIATMSNKLTGVKIKLHLDKSAKISAVEKRNFVANSSLFYKTAGWKPQTLLKSGLRKTLEYLLMAESK